MILTKVISAEKNFIKEAKQKFAALAVQHKHNMTNLQTENESKSAENF